MPVRLALARARPEIVAVNDERFLEGLAGFVDDGDAALLAQGWIGQNDVVFVMLRSERALGYDRQAGFQGPAARLGPDPALNYERQAVKVWAVSPVASAAALRVMLSQAVRLRGALSCPQDRVPKP